MIENTRLSKNFLLYELLYSETAERDPDLDDLQYNPSIEVVENLKFLTEHALQPMRSFLGCSISCSSGYRSLTLNTLIRSKKTSQHVVGQAGDVSLSSRFLKKNKYKAAKSFLNKQVFEITGKHVRKDVNANFYLFALAVLNMKKYKIDQLIHEYGRKLGQPAWVHVASSSRSKGEICTIGRYGNKKVTKKILTLEEALALGT